MGIAVPDVGNQVSLHYATLPTQPGWPAGEELLGRLPAARRERLARYPAAARDASLLGLALLERAAHDCAPQRRLAALVFPARGKPYWPDGPDFSIAHSGELVACALATAGRVGLDLERADRVSTQQLRLVLDARERAAIAAGELTATAAFVMKEAVVKASGAGLTALGRVRLAGAAAELDGSIFRLSNVPVPPPYLAYLATDRPLAASVTPRAHAAAELASPAST
jgi:4'-phosphopantetheinyl transferase